MTDITLGTVGGEYMESAVLVEWRVQNNARVAAGDVVALVETAKATSEIEAPTDGVLSILVDAGDEVAVGTVLAVLDRPAPPVMVPAPEPKAAPAPPPPTPRPPGIERRWPQAYASPLAKRVATEGGIDLSRVRGSGPNGRIVYGDLPATSRDSAGLGYSMALEVDATVLQDERARQWERGGRPSTGDLVVNTARAALRQIGVAWPVLLDTLEPPLKALSVLDLTPYGITDFTPPPWPGRAVLALAMPRADTLRLSLAADAATLPCLTIAQFLARLRAGLETPTPEQSRGEISP